MGLWNSNIVMLGAEGSADRVTEAFCTPEMFDILGAKPVIGRFFTLENDRVGEDKVIVLTQSFWESHFAEDPAVCSKTMRIDGETYRIIGVAPRAIEAFDIRANFIKPLSWSMRSVSQYSRFALNTQLYARLKAGHSPGSALSEATAVERRYYEVAPANMKAFLDNSGHAMAVVPIQDERTRPVTSSLVLLQGAAVFVLLVGCVNIANLLLARTNSRQHEIAIRSALGASRRAIVLQFMTEYLLLIVLGIVVGVGIALACLPFANHFIVKVLPNTLPVKLDAGALSIATGLFLLVGLVVGFLPVLSILRTKLTGGIPVNVRGSSGGPGDQGVQQPARHGPDFGRLRPFERSRPPCAQFRKGDLRRPWVRRGERPDGEHRGAGGLSPGAAMARVSGAAPPGDPGDSRSGVRGCRDERPVSRRGQQQPLCDQGQQASPGLASAGCPVHRGLSGLLQNSPHSAPGGAVL